MINGFKGIVPILGTMLLFSLQAHAATITEGFEGSSYDVATTGNGAATLSSSQVHSGSQSLNMSLTTGSDYARVKLGESGLTLGQITGANYWVYNNGADITGNTGAAVPYVIFSINCNTCGGNDNTLAVMWDPASLGIYPTPNTWTNIVVDPNTTLFHVEGDTAGIANASHTTLAAISNSLDGGDLWGSFSVDFVRIGFGQEGNDGKASNFFVDDLTIDAASTTPLPAALPMFASGLGALGFLGCRRKKKAVGLAA